MLHALTLCPPEIAATGHTESVRRRQSPRPRWRERSRLVRMLRLVRTRRPKTFTEKVRYKMLRDHRRLVVMNSSSSDTI